MERYNATVIEIDSESYLALNIGENSFELPLTKDEPNVIKNIFNKLILLLKKNEFEFFMEDKEEGDIIFQVAKEYIANLNSELKEIHKELKESNLLDSK